jgi:hypothetical protein
MCTSAKGKASFSYHFKDNSNKNSFCSPFGGREDVHFVSVYTPPFSIMIRWCTHIGLILEQLRLNGVSKWICYCRRHRHRISPDEDYMLLSSMQNDPLTSFYDVQASAHRMALYIFLFGVSVAPYHSRGKGRMICM